MELLARNVSPIPPRNFFKEYKTDGRPWLIVGMGPSFSRIYDYDITGYNILGINKVVRHIPVDICHIIDFYIVDKVKRDIVKQADVLLTPYMPHFGYRPNLMFTIDHIYPALPDKIRNKIMCYNLCTGIPFNDSPIIKAKYFNAEASLNIIANLGCKEVYAIGIDGGDKRADEFSDHGPCDPRGFDLQWDSMANTIVDNNISYLNLDSTRLNTKLQELIDAKHNSAKRKNLSV